MSVQEECSELFLQDVVRVDIMPAAALRIGVPFNVPDAAAAQVTMANGDPLTDGALFAASLLSMTTGNDGQADAVMQEGVTHKVAERNDAIGMVRTHTLQVTVETGSDAVRGKEAGLHGAYFHIILTTVDVTRYLAYGLPNTCQFTVDDQLGGAVRMTVRAVLQSMSGMIKIE